MAETYRPPQGVRDEAKRALGWIADGHAGSGFTATGRKRANDLAAGKALSAETILRMYSFLKRHEVDKSAEGFNAGEDGFPSPGRVAWSAWGGDPALSWTSKIRNQIQSSVRALSILTEENGMANTNEMSDLNEELTELLADVFSFYLRAHGAHWNVVGTDFAEYHKLFNDIYDDVYSSIDPIAENLRKLGSKAPFTLPQFIALRTLDDSNIASSDARVLATDLLNANDVIILSINDAFNCATWQGQQGIANFLAERLDKHQMWKWQLSASLGIEPAPLDLTEESPEEQDEEGMEEDSMYMPMPIADRAASGASDLPIAPRDKAWDAAAADKRVQDWAGGKDNMDWAKYGKAFFYVDPEKKELLGGYKLQFADVVDGELTAIPRGIFAVAGVLQGARGGADIPQADQDAIKKKVAAYYSKMAKEFEDDSIVEPWANRASAARIGEGSFVSWNTSNGRARGKVEKVITKGTATSSDGFVIEATPDQPAFSVRIYKQQGNGWVPTDTVVVHRNDYLTITGALPTPRSEEIPMVEERKSAIASAEKLTMTAEVRAMDTEDGSLRIAGYAATFNKEADGLNFREVIAPGAFTRALASGDPVFLLVNHDMEAIPLASTQSGTLQLRQDKTGLYIEAELDPQNPRAQELASALRRGDMDKMSFAFTVGADGQTREGGLRTLTEIERLFEVSVVTLPAYSSTTVGMRNVSEDLEVKKKKLAIKVKQHSLRSRKA
jgi:HK97 family phage prohead protease